MGDRIDLAILLGQKTADLLSKIGRAATGLETRSFLVGGGVRDLLLGRFSPDIDVMVETDAGLFVPELHRQWKTLFPELPLPKKPVVFPKFKTAKLNFETDIVPGVRTVDFSSARKERYPSSGHPPEISLADLEADIRRRDFSVNALAIDLSPDRFGELIDIVNGAKHLQEGTLAILHPESFVDDPARLLRGVRFAERFGFRWDGETEKRFREAAEGEFLNRLTPQRRLDELRKALSEPEVEKVVKRLIAEDLLRAVLFELKLSDSDLERLSASAVSGRPWEAIFATLTAGIPEERLVEWLKACRTPAAAIERIRDAR